MIDYPEDFCIFWKAYRPTKSASKLDAAKAWSQTAKIRPSQDLMLAMVAAYNSWLSDQEKRQGKEYPKLHPATFLRQARYEGFETDARAILEAQEALSGLVGGRRGGGWTDGWVDPLRAAGVSADEMEKWFFPADLAYYIGRDRVEIICPTPFHAQELEKRFGNVLRKAFGESVQLTVAAKK